MPGTVLKPFGARLSALGVSDRTVLSEIERLGVSIAELPARIERKASVEGKDFEVLLRGWAFRFRYLRNGTRHIAGLILAGDPCNIDSVDFGPGNFQLGTLTGCKIATVDGRAFHDLCDRSPPVRRAVTVLSMAENAMLREWTLSLAQRSAIQRVAHLLCELQVRLSAVGEAEADGYAFPLTQIHLGELLGLTPVHVNRTLQAMRADRLFELSESRLRVANWEALATVAEFNPEYLTMGKMAAAA
jgi:CRP-like cAMP-binding protein